MIQNIVFVEDKDIQYIQAIEDVAIEHGYKFASYRTGVELIKDLRKFSFFDTFFIIDFFLPSLQGSDLIKIMKQRGFKAKNIVITSIAHEVAKKIYKQFKILGAINKTNTKDFKLQVQAYLDSRVIPDRTINFLGNRVLIDLHYGCILHKTKPDHYIKLTKSETYIFERLKIRKIGNVIGVSDADVSLATVYRLNQKLQKLHLKFNVLPKGNIFQLEFIQTEHEN